MGLQKHTRDSAAWDDSAMRWLSSFWCFVFCKIVARWVYKTTRVRWQRDVLGFAHAMLFCNKFARWYKRESHAMMRFVGFRGSDALLQGDMQLKRAIQHGLKRSKKCNNISVEPKINVKKFPLTANVWLLKYGSFVAHPFKSFLKHASP